MYKFLVKLPADENILKSIDADSTSHKDIFSLGHPFKTLYAVHALREYLNTQRRKEAVAEGVDEQNSSPTSARDAGLTRVMSLVVAAISDPEVISQCPGRELQIDLSSSLMDCLLSLLIGEPYRPIGPVIAPRAHKALIQDPLLPSSASQYLDSHLLERLLDILEAMLSADRSDVAVRHVPVCLHAILESCSRSIGFWEAFRSHEAVPRVLGSLIVHDERPRVRHEIAQLVMTKAGISRNVLTDPAVTR